MKTYLNFGAAILFLLFSSEGYSWGDQGHSIVALVAQQVLTAQSDHGDAQAAQALKAVQAILGDTKIDQAATWPDKVKSQSRQCSEAPYVKDPSYKTGQSSAICDAYRFTANWHFINTDNTEYVSDPSGKDFFQGDLAVIIAGLAHTLKNELASGLNGVSSFTNWKTECLKKVGHNCKKEALEFLIHFVGDIHQPLHSGAACDLGGNDQYIVFFGEEKDPAASWCKPTDPATCSNHELHQAWDTSLLLRDPGNSPFVSNAAYAAKLVQTMSGKKQSADAKCVTVAPESAVNIDDSNGPVNWANESICYMPQVYTFWDDTNIAKKKTKKGARAIAQVANDVTSSQTSSVTNRCRDDRKIGVGRSAAYSAFQVGQKYYDTNIVTINERLYWGGNRLATLLKHIYGSGDKVTELGADVSAENSKRAH